MKNVEKILYLNLLDFDNKFNSLFEERNKILRNVLKYIIKSKGKRIRPLFVFLSAKIAGEINEQTIRAACMIELLHTATLVHDDVVDESLQRRNYFSIKAIWKNKIAVLVGDYLLAKGLLLCVENEDFQLLKIASKAVKEMSEGELLQIEKARKLDITEDIYFEIIRSKTASLLASACSAGAYSSSQNLLVSEDFRLIGEKAGIAFQIKDDLLDYGHKNIGKPTSGDLKEKKMTLPLIHTLQFAPLKIKKEIIYIIKNRITHKLPLVMSYVEEYGGLDYAKKVMGHYKNQAIELLEKFPNTEEKAAMIELIEFTIQRDK